MNDNKITSYRDLIVWQRAKDFVIALYRSTEQFPKHELFGLTSQIRRAAVSIPSNIAEGFNRRTKKEQVQFLRVAYGSGAEVETQLIIAKELGYLEDKEYNILKEALDEVMKMLNTLISKFNKSQ